jgi:hypothetical protein
MSKIVKNTSAPTAATRKRWERAREDHKRRSAKPEIDWKARYLAKHKARLETREVLRELLHQLPSLSCDDMDHIPGDYDHPPDHCPPLIRYKEAQTAAREQYKKHPPSWKPLRLTAEL